jgi:adenylosuccinate lyase
MADTLLERVPGWSEEDVARLKSSWITTAEQVVALSATERGILSLAEQLEVSEEEANRLVECARAVLAPDTRAEMEEAVDTSEYGMGALQPRRGEGRRSP